MIPTPKALELPRKPTADSRRQPPRTGRLLILEEAIFPDQSKEIADNRGKPPTTQSGLNRRRGHGFNSCNLD